MNEQPQQVWFEMPDVRRRRLATSVWIPLRRSEVVAGRGAGREIGDWEDLDCVGAVAISAEHRELGNRLGWSDIGLIHSAAPFASPRLPYKPADVYWYNDGQPVGAELVLEQRYNSDHEREWLVSQDLVMALGLLKEGDRWLRVDEGYVEVLRQRRDAAGQVVSIEIKSEFLRDYLAARGMALRVAQYKRRMAILKDVSYLSWSKQAVEVNDGTGRFEGRVFGIDVDGGVAGGGVAVMQVWRTDVDHQEDVPVFGQESDENTAYQSFTYERPAQPYAFRAEGELWREEWIEPAAQSVRVRRDDPAEQLRYVVDASGEALSASELNNEDVGRWLWFRPQVVDALLAFRGSALTWYTRQTGSVKCSPDYETHFGVNAGGLINVYAYDIAKLPLWQQRVWAGHNVTPDGPVSAELLSAQMGQGPAKTRAPERLLVDCLQRLDDLFRRLHGAPLFRGHSERPTVLARIHRFRVLGVGGVLSLAKDVARVTADSIDITLLRELVKPSDEKLGSLKLLQSAMAARIGAERAREIMGPLVGIYDLRLGDAHLPAGSLSEAFELVGIDVVASPVEQALQLLDRACSTLESIHEVLSAA